MDRLQQTLEEVLMDAPYQVFAEMLAKRLASQGVVLTARERQKLIEHVKSVTTDTFSLRKWWRFGQDIDIEVTEEEIEELNEQFSELLEHKLPGLIRSTIDDLSSDILHTLKLNWSTELRRQNHKRRDFEKSLHKQWGLGIDRLRMFLTVAREFGELTNSSLRNEQDINSPVLIDILTRLHARGCQVTEEILCLMSAGLADGAMARWRTLHEIAVVALFLKEHGEDSAIRYTDHEIVESFRAACDYEACCERLGYEPMSKSEFEKARQAYDHVIKIHGLPFKAPYGWAAGAPGVKNPSFQEIEKKVGIDHLRAHYRIASHNIHGNPKGVFFKLGLVDESACLLAGPSNTGLADPGHSAAVSLLQISTALGLIKPNLDVLVILRILARLTDEVGEALGDAHQYLEGDIS